jgi:hypothetical protein
MFVVSLSQGNPQSRQKAREFARSETITIKPRRESKESGLAATCRAILIPISDFSCSQFSEFLCHRRRETEGSMIAACVGGLRFRVGKPEHGGYSFRDQTETDARFRLGSICIRTDAIGAAQ